MEEHITRNAVLGAELKKIRESKGLSLEDVSAHLRIQPDYLNRIETDRLDLLPSGFYRKTFIKEYCRYFGAEALWKQYEAFFDEIERQKALEQAAASACETASENKLVREREYKLDNNKPLLIGAGIMLLAAIVFIFVFRTSVISGAKGDKVMQLSGGTEVIIEQKKEQERKQEQIAEEKAKKLSEERAKAEEAEVEKEADNQQQEAAQQTDVANDTPLAKNELLIFAPTQDITIKASQGQAMIFEGKIEKGKSMRLKVEGELPMCVRYENPNKTEVTYAEKEFKPLHPSDKGRSRYYWSDGAITFTRNKQQQ